MQTQNIEDNYITVMIQRLGDKDSEIQNNAIQSLIVFLKDHKNTFRIQNHVSEILSAYENTQDANNKQNIADLLSVIKNDVSYRVNGNVIPLKEWGHQYVKEMLKQLLEMNLKEQKVFKKDEKKYFSEKYECIENELIKFLFDNNLEIDAIDYLVETGKESKLIQHVDQHNKRRIVNYLDGLSKAGDSQVNAVIYEIFVKHDMFIEQLIFHISFNKIPEAFQLIEKMPSIYKLQANFILHKLRLRKFPSNLEEYSQKDFNLKRTDINGTKIFNILGQCLHNFGICNSDESIPLNMELEDNYLYGLIFANSPFDFSAYSNKINGLLSLSLNRREEEEVTFALLREELEENVSNEILLSLFLVETYNQDLIPKDFLLDILNSIPEEMSTTIDNRAVAAFVLCTSPSMISSQDETITTTILNIMQDKKINASSNLILILALSMLYFGIREKPIKLFAELDTIDIFGKQAQVLLLGMIYQGTGNATVIEEVLTICFGEQEITHLVDEAIGENDESSEKNEKEESIKQNEEYSSYSDTSHNSDIFTHNCHCEQLGLISLSLISMGNSLTSLLGARIINASALLENVFLKRVIPLCLGLLYNGSNNNIAIDDLLRGVSGAENGVLFAKLLGVGLVASGTNNTHVIEILRLIKRCSLKNLAIGLTNLGQGTVTTDLYNYKKKVLNKKGLAGICLLMLLLLDGEESLIFKEPYFFLSLVPSIQSRVVATVKQTEDEKYEFVEKEVNVGKRVNVTGLKGNPREITGIYKMTTPFTLKWDENGENDDGVMDYFEDVMVLK